MMVLVVMLCWYSWVALVAGYAGGHIGRMHTDVRTGMGMGMGMGTHAHTHSHTALHMNLKPTTRKDDNGRRLDLNWRAGLCKHRVAFEASDTIRRLRFTGDLCAFGLLDGRLCVVRMSSGEIVARFKNHSHEITALDFDGRELVSGSAAGRTVVYESLEGWGEGREGGEGEGGDGYGDGDGESGESGERGGKGKTFGGVKFKFRHHSRAVTGARIVTVDGVGGVRGDKVKGVEGEGDMVEGGEGERGAGENGQQERGEGVQGAQGVQGFSGGSRGIIGRRKILITCGMDKMLVAVDMTSGLLLYKVTLPAAPLCMDAQGSGTGRYIALGLINGLVLFVNAQTGQTILSFQAHSNRVRSLHFSADQVLLTGSNKGVVKRWDLSGDPGEPGNPGGEKGGRVHLPLA
ncbi:WD40-repeat-containing domain protein [Ochromonadaceae sp. CCMP2298]|nr:WD40-repeat-containing domain protein [Ochromonadaceae sp. CCMP2298]